MHEWTIAECVHDRYAVFWIICLHIASIQLKLKCNVNEQKTCTQLSSLRSTLVEAIFNIIDDDYDDDDKDDDTYLQNSF